MAIKDWSKVLDAVDRKVEETHAQERAMAETDMVALAVEAEAARILHEDAVNAEVVAAAKAHADKKIVDAKKTTLRELSKDATGPQKKAAKDDVDAALAVHKASAEATGVASKARTDTMTDLKTKNRARSARSKDVDTSKQKDIEAALRAFYANLATFDDEAALDAYLKGDELEKLGKRKADKAAEMAEIDNEIAAL